MKPYRFIGVILVNVDKNGASKTEGDWQIDIKGTSTQRFALINPKRKRNRTTRPEGEGLETVFEKVQNELNEII